jgi:hypothetical protein
MRRLTFIVLAAALIVAGLALASAAQAAPDGRVQSQRLVSVDTVSWAGPTKLVSRSALATIYCKTVAKKVIGESYFGVNLWYVRQALRWCYTVEGAGGQVQRWISSATPKCKGSTYGIYSAGFFWEFKGWVECRAGGGVGKAYDSVMRYRKGHFAYCPSACVQNYQPFAWVRGYSDGTFKRGGGGAP